MTPAPLDYLYAFLFTACAGAGARLGWGVVGRLGLLLVGWLEDLRRYLLRRHGGRA